MTRSIFQNARIIGDNIDVSQYLSLVSENGETIKRGDANYPMTRSALMSFAECPSRWKKGYDRKDSTSTDWGNLIDAAILSNKLSIAVAPEYYPCEQTKKDQRTEKPWNRNATFCKEWEASREAKGITVLTHDEEANLNAAIASIRDDSEIRQLIECCKTQVMVVAEYHDTETGIVVPVRILADLVPDKEHHKYGFCMADLKTSQTASPRLWPFFVEKYGYDVQAALYLDIYNAATGENRTDWLHVIQENYPPFECGRRVLSSEFVQDGRIKYMSALARYCRCLKDSKWPGYDVVDWTVTEPTPAMRERAMRSIPEIVEPPEREEVESEFPS